MNTPLRSKCKPWLALACFALLAVAAQGDVDVGSTRDEVIKEWGEPKGRVGGGAFEELLYPNGVQVSIRNGKVTKIANKEAMKPNSDTTAAPPAQAGFATQTFSIEEAHATLVLPKDWIKMPERGLDRFRQSANATAPHLKTHYVAGFAGPRPPPNTPLTLLLVQIFPRDFTPRAFIASIPAAKKAITAAEPDLKIEQTAPFVDAALGAVVAPGRSEDGHSGRTYVIPMSQGVIALDLFCPTSSAEETFGRFDSCLKKISFTSGIERDGKWLDEFKTVSKVK